VVAIGRACQQSRLRSDSRPSPLGCCACSEEIVRPSNSFQLAPLSEEFSRHFVQPSVRIHDKEHSRRRLISRHDIRRSAVQAQRRGYLRVYERPGMPSGPSGHARGCGRAPLRTPGLLRSRPRTKLRAPGFLWIPPLNPNWCIPDLPPTGPSQPTAWVKVLASVAMRAMSARFSAAFTIHGIKVLLYVL
jgi:hypothetical protein